MPPGRSHRDRRGRGARARAPPLRLATWNLNHWRQPMLPTDTRRGSLGAPQRRDGCAGRARPGGRPAARDARARPGGLRRAGGPPELGLGGRRARPRDHHRAAALGAHPVVAAAVPAGEHAPGLGRDRAADRGRHRADHARQRLRGHRRLGPCPRCCASWPTSCRCSTRPTAPASSWAATSTCRARPRTAVSSPARRRCSGRSARSGSSRRRRSSPTCRLRRPTAPAARRHVRPHRDLGRRGARPPVRVARRSPAQVTAMSVDPGVVAAGLSDHVPLVLDLALSPERTPHTWDEESFAEEIGRRHGPAAREVVEKLVNWADRRSGSWPRPTGVRTKDAHPLPEQRLHDRARAVVPGRPQPRAQGVAAHDRHPRRRRRRRPVRRHAPAAIRHGGRPQRTAPGAQRDRRRRHPRPGS